MNKQEFKKEIEALSIPISDTQLEQFEEYARLLKEWNEKMNLTAITEDSEIDLNEMIRFSVFEIM